MLNFLLFDIILTFMYWKKSVFHVQTCYKADKFQGLCPDTVDNWVNEGNQENASVFRFFSEINNKDN